MNSQDIFVGAKRLKTFYGMPYIEASEKVDLVTKGFYAHPQSNKVKCIRCTEMFILTKESIPILRTHNCNRAFHNSFQKEPVPYLSSSVGCADDLYYEEFRVATFLKWAVKDEITVKALAKSGFYLTLDEKTIKCCYCKFSLCEASQGGANATRAHLTFHPECLVNKKERDNAIKTTFQKKYPQNITASEIDVLCKLMDSVLFEKALEMGFSEADIRSTAENRKTLGLSNFSNIEQLLEALTSSAVQPTLGPNKKPDEESKLCSICMTTNYDTAFVPCGHLVTCADCAKTVVQGSKLCPICRIPITTYVKVFPA